MFNNPPIKNGPAKIAGLFLKWVVLGRNLTYCLYLLRLFCTPLFSKIFQKRPFYFTNDSFSLMNSPFGGMNKIRYLKPFIQGGIQKPVYPEQCLACINGIINKISVQNLFIT